MDEPLKNFAWAVAIYSRGMSHWRLMVLDVKIISLGGWVNAQTVQHEKQSRLEGSASILSHFHPSKAVHFLQVS